MEAAESRPRAGLCEDGWVDVVWAGVGDSELDEGGRRVTLVGGGVVGGVGWEFHVVDCVRWG